MEMKLNEMRIEINFLVDDAYKYRSVLSMCVNDFQID